jgi:hypothetical protein
MDHEVDPRQAEKLSMLGVADSGIIERIVVALLSGLAKLAAPIIALAASVFDSFLTGLSEFFFDAQGQRGEGFYLLCAAIMKDLTGIDVDGAKLAADFKANGRLSAMQDLGGSLINVLASEFAGEAQGQGPGGFTVTKGDGIGGLPAKGLTPAGGVDAARALMGFMTSFAIREGNTDILADYLPWGLGRWFKDFAEDFSKNVGLGRLARVAFRPLFATMVGVPLQWALNQQYRPTLLSPEEAFRGFLAGTLSNDEFLEEMSRHGYSDTRRGVLTVMHSKPYPTNDIKILRLLGTLDDASVIENLKRSGFDQFTATNILKAWDSEAFREASLTAARHFVQTFLAGDITGDELRGAITNVGGLSTGSLLLSDSEVRALTSLATEEGAFPRKRISPAQMKQALIDGTVDILEYEDYLTVRGYPARDVNILGIEALIAAKQHDAAKKKQEAAAAAKAAAAANKIPPPTPTA